VKKIAITAVFLMGCMHSSFLPNTSRIYPQVRKVATVIYDGDLPGFVQCDVIKLGIVSMGGNSFVSHNDLLERAQVIAAERGATHLLVIDNSTTTYLTSVYTNCYGVGGNVNCNSTPINFPKPVGTYEALRITCNIPAGK
jgi:hypothetical protein